MTAITMPAESNANIQASTRELWRRTVQRQVFLKNPMMARMLLANRMIWQGGQNLIGPLDIAEVDDHIEWYGVEDRLGVKTKSVLHLAKFKWKNFQLPVQYGLEEELSTSQGGMTEVFDLKKFLVTKAHRGVRIALVNQFYGADSSGTRAANNSLTATNHE